VHGVGGNRAGILILLSGAGAKCGGVGKANFIRLCRGVGVWDSMFGTSGGSQSSLTGREGRGLPAGWWVLMGGCGWPGEGGIPVCPPGVHSAGSPWAVEGGPTGSNPLSQGVYLKPVPATGGIFSAFHPPGSLPVRFLVYLCGRGYAAIGPLLPSTWRKSNICTQRSTFCAWPDWICHLWPLHCCGQPSTPSNIT
jgi:hypothetical protein